MSSLAVYFEKILSKYSFITFIWITDADGVIVQNLANSKNPNSMNLDAKVLDKVKSTLSYVLNSSYDQIVKIEKEKLKCIMSVYENQTLFQSKLNSNFYIHILFNTEESNIEILKLITQDINENISLKELNSIFENN